MFAEIASDALKGRVFEVSLADLQNDEVAFRKFKLVSEEVQGRNVLTNFHGMDMTTDKLRSMVKKWQVSYCLSLENICICTLRTGKNFVYCATAISVFVKMYSANIQSMGS